MFLNHIQKPSLYLPGCMIIWGTISALTGITTQWVFRMVFKGCSVTKPCHSFIAILLTRFFLGFVEAAFFPGALFLISKWSVGALVQSKLIHERRGQVQVG